MQELAGYTYRKTSKQKADFRHSENNTYRKVLQNAKWSLNKKVVKYFLQFCKQHKYTACDKQTEQCFQTS